MPTTTQPASRNLADRGKVFQNIDEMFDDAVKRNSAEGLMNHLDFALHIRDEALAGLNEELQGEAANDFYLTAEAAKKPRTLGISQYNDTVLHALWFDEKVVYRKPGTDQFYDWWDPNNEPPPNREGKLKHGVDWQKVRLPLRNSDPVSLSLLSKFKGDEGKARRFCWEQAAVAYAANTVYKIMRGDSEQWAGGFEPAVFLDQKPTGSKDLSTPDMHVMFLQIAKMQLDNLKEEEAELQRRHPPKELSPLKRKQRAYLVSHIEKILAADIVRMRPKFLPPNWRETEVKSSFRGFSAVGREIYKQIQAPIARALGNSRRQQARMMRIIGIEVPDEGSSMPTEDSIMYSRMSEAYDLNPYLTNAILTRSGLNVELKLIDKIKKRLNEWREMHGLPPVDMKPFSDRPQPPMEDQVDSEGNPIEKKVKAKKGRDSGDSDDDDDLTDEEKAAAARKKREQATKKERADRYEALLRWPPPTVWRREGKNKDAWRNERSKDTKMDYWDEELRERGLDVMDSGVDELMDKMKNYLKPNVQSYDDDFFGE